MGYNIASFDNDCTRVLLDFFKATIASFIALRDVPVFFLFKPYLNKKNIC